MCSHATVEKKNLAQKGACFSLVFQQTRNLCTDEMAVQSASRVSLLDRQGYDNLVWRLTRFASVMNVHTLWKGAPPLRRDIVELDASVKVESKAHSTKYATTVLSREQLQSVRTRTVTTTHFAINITRRPSANDAQLKISQNTKTDTLDTRIPINVSIS